MGLRFQPSARANTIQITVNVELQKICRVITRTTSRFRLNALKPSLFEIELVDKGIDKPNQVVGTHIIVDRLGQQQRLGPVHAFNMRIASSRRLERETQRNIEMMWLTGRLMPDFKTIANFRKVNAKALRSARREFVVLCRNLDLFAEDACG